MLSYSVFSRFIQVFFVVNGVKDRFFNSEGKSQEEERKKSRRREENKNHQEKKEKKTGGKEKKCVWVYVAIEHRS